MLATDESVNLKRDRPMLKSNSSYITYSILAK